MVENLSKQLSNNVNSIIRGSQGGQIDEGIKLTLEKLERENKEKV